MIAAVASSAAAWRHASPRTSVPAAPAREQVRDHHPELVGQGEVVVQPRHRAGRAPALGRARQVGQPLDQRRARHRPGRGTARDRGRLRQRAGSSARPGARHDDRRPRRNARPPDRRAQARVQVSRAAQVAEQAQDLQVEPDQADQEAERAGPGDLLGGAGATLCSIRSKSRMNVSDATTMTTRLNTMASQLPLPSRCRAGRCRRRRS